MTDAEVNIRRLLANRSDDATGAIVKAIISIDVAHLLNGFAHYGRHVDPGARGDLACDQYEAGRGGRFTCDARCGVLREDGVKHAIGNLVTQLIGMALRHRFAGKKCLWITHKITHEVKVTLLSLS